MPSKRHYFFYVAASLFCLTSHWLCHALTEGVESARRKSYAPESGKATRKTSAPDDPSTPQRSKIDSTQDLIDPNHDVANTEITGSEFEKVRQKQRNANRLFYKQTSTPDKEFDRKKSQNQAISLIKRPAQNKLTTLLDNPTLMSNDTSQNILINPKKKEPDGARINRTLNTQPLNLTVNVAKLDLCVFVCLAHGSCLGAIFEVRTSVCKLRSKYGDLTDQQAPFTGVEIHNYGNDDVKFFTVNHKMLTNIIGKCADQPCRNGTFCSHLSDASYACLPLDLGGRLTRKKRSLTEAKPDARHKNSTHKQPINCGLPPTYPKVLSLFTKTTIGATTTYYCENGVHTENAHTVIICQPNGEWSKSNFRCTHPVPCPKPKQIPGTIMHDSEQNGTNVVKYICKNNPYLSNQTICNRQNGTWSPLEMNCNSHTDGAKPLVLENKRDHIINWKPFVNKQSNSTYPTRDGITSKQNKTGSSPYVNKQRRAALEPVSNETSNGNNTTDQDFNHAGSVTTSTVPLSNVASDGNNTMGQDLGPEEGVVTSAIALSNRTFSNNNTTNYDLGPSVDFYTIIVPESTSDTHYTTQKSDDYDDVTVTFWGVAPPKTKKILPPFGIMSDNVNTMTGLPGFFCWYPAPVTFAIGFYSSRIIGSKILYQCSRYMFSTPVPYCPIVTCLTDGFWSELSISCSDLDCIKPPNQYVGKRMCSSLGFQCRNWDEVIRDPYQLSIVSFPDGNITMAKNYCRDPLRSGFLWCFTKNPSVVWDFCDVPTCS